MGVLALRKILGDDVEYYWPPDHTSRKHHWCLDSSREEGSYYCDDESVGPPQYDSSFDYSVFRCRDAKCQICLDVDPVFFPPRELWPSNYLMKKDSKSREIHFTWNALVESKEKGCEICGVLVEGIERVGGGTAQFDPDYVFRLEILEGYTVRATMERKPVEGSGMELNKFCAEFYSFDQTAPFKAFCPAGRVSRDIDAAHCVKFVQNHVQKCTGHSKCLSTEASIVPTRVIDVGTGKDDIKLEVSPKAGELYTTLSHVWGRATLPKTTSANFEERCKNIPWSTLTKTFQDAVTITRGLGIRYLWIDSICIIQGSKADFEVEGKNMGNIYMNSYLTFAATSAHDGSEGLLRSRYNFNEAGDHEDTQEYEILRRSNDNMPDQTIFARRPMKYSHEFLLTLDYEVTHIRRAPLLHRSWVLQERLLSARTLHFCSDELVWECKTGIECECGYGASASGRAESDSLSGRNIFRELFVNNQNPEGKKLNDISSSDQEDEFLLAWYRLVVYYTTLDITFASDRLPALRGMTKYIEDKMGWTYLEGLWIHDFVRGALFCRDSSRICLRRDDVPTWSWASTELRDEWVPSNYFTFPLAKDKKSWKVDEGFRIVEHSASGGCTRQNLDSSEYVTIGQRPFIVLDAAFVEAKIIPKKAEEPEPSESQSNTGKSDAAVSGAAEIQNSFDDGTSTPNVLVDEPKVSQGLDSEGPDSCSLVQSEVPQVVGDQSGTESEASVTDANDQDEKESDSDEPASTKQEWSLLVEGNTNDINATWDVSDKFTYAEVSEDDAVLAILLAHDESEVISSHGLVLRRQSDGLYKRIGYFSAPDSQENFREGNIKQVVLV